MSQTHSHTRSRLAFSTISPMLVFFSPVLHLEIDNEAISDGCESENDRYLLGFIEF